MKNPIHILLPLLFIGFIALNSVQIIEEGQQAILLQLRKPIGEPVKQAGLYFKIPFFQKYRIFEKRILRLGSDNEDILTNDKTFIRIQTAAFWKIENPLRFLQRFPGNSESQATRVLINLVNSAVKQFITENALNEVVLSSDWKPEYSVAAEKRGDNYEVSIGRDNFSKKVLNSVSEVAKDYGLTVIDVLIRKINYTDSSRQKVYERMISERKRIAAKIRSAGEGQREEILGQLDRRLKEIASEAYKKAQKIKGDADGTATKIYGEAYSLDNSFFKFYTAIESYNEVMGKNTKLVIDVNSDLYKYLQSTQP